MSLTRRCLLMLETFTGSVLSEVAVHMWREAQGAYSKPASTHIKTGEHLLSTFGALAARVGAALVLLC